MNVKPEIEVPTMLIDGEWIRTRQRSQDNINPATEEVLSTVPHADQSDLDAALSSAEMGLKTWRGKSPDERSSILLATAQIIRERAEEMGPIMSLEQGKPLREAVAEFRRAADLIEWDANEAKRHYGRIIPAPSGERRMTFREPIGVVAAFTPWNFPVSVLARKLGGPLAAGCSVIVKPSEETPASATALVRCFVDAGLPRGVINLVFGVPDEVSSYLIPSPIVQAITFTGSVPVGKHLAALAAGHMKPAVMELGGHSPVVVCDDTDVREAARICAAGKFRNAGQICTAPTRFIVQESVYDDFVGEFTAAAEAIRIGSGLSPDTEMGPMANWRRLTSMNELVEDAHEKGATICTGGTRHGNVGYFFKPTVISDVPVAAKLMQSEPFGPIASVQKYSNMDEAVTMANATPYGLAAYAFTESAGRAAFLADEIETGIMSINHTGGSIPEAPFGGVKDSGYGREGGAEGLDEYSVIKFVSHRASLKLASSR